MSWIIHARVCVCVCVCVWVLSCFSCLQLFATLWAVVLQAPMSMGFSRQESWSRLPFPPPGDPPSLGIEPMFVMSPALAARFVCFFLTTSVTWEAHLGL